MPHQRAAAWFKQHLTAILVVVILLVAIPSLSGLAYVLIGVRDTGCDTDRRIALVFRDVFDFLEHRTLQNPDLTQTEREQVAAVYVELRERVPVRDC